MAQEVEELLRDSSAYERSARHQTKREAEMRRESVDTRPSDAEWPKPLAKRRKGSGKSKGDDAALHGKKIRAADVQHAIRYSRPDRVNGQ